MHYLFTWETGHPTLDVRLRQARQHWEELTLGTNPAAKRELSQLSHSAQPALPIPPSWMATFYLLPYPEQILLAFVWLHWWQQSAEEEAGFGGWLIQGPGLVLNHVSLLKVLTEQQPGILGSLHGFLEKNRRAGWGLEWRPRKLPAYCPAPRRAQHRVPLSYSCPRIMARHPAAHTRLIIITLLIGAPRSSPFAWTERSCKRALTALLDMRYF